MRIRSFHIQGFGKLSQVTVDALPQGMSVFLGRNEAGKSTCLEFFRAMLTGFPHPKSREGREKWLSPGQTGGSLLLDTQAHGLLRLTRQPGPGGGTPALFDSHGGPVDMAVLDRLMGGITREVYRNIYGFSLTELQSFESLDKEGVRSALYGASFGLGLNAPAQALKKLEEGMESIFKSNGKNPPLNQALREWEELQKNLREELQKAAEYDNLCEKEARAAEVLAASRAERSELEAERRLLEKRLGVWKQWEEWRLARARQERLPKVAETFPQDGLSRLEKLLDRKEAAHRLGLIASERLERVRAALESNVPDTALLEAEGLLRSLGERKASCRNALSLAPSLRADIARAEEQLAAQLATLGPHWTTDRIRAMDRSLFVREEVERQSQDMQAAATACNAAMSALDRCCREQEQSLHAVDVARITLEALPEPEAELDLPARESLRAQQARVEEARRRLPERQKNLAMARVEYSRSLSHLNLRPDASSGALQILADAQGQALHLAEELRARTEDAANAAREAQLMRKEEEAAMLRLARVQSQGAEMSGSDRASLENRRSSLRRLRQLAAMLEQENERLADLQERHAALETALPRPRPKLPLLILGGLLFLLGGGMLLAQLGLGLHSLDLSFLTSLTTAAGLLPGWDGSMPLTLWVAYMGLFAGVICLTLGLPRSGPDAERNHLLLEQTRTRRDASADKASELGAEIQTLCGSLGLRSPEVMLLDALEAQLDQEREQCVTSERLQQEGALLQEELNAKRRQLQTAEAEHAQADAAVQTTRRRWHDYFMRLGLISVPSPESAAAYFAKVEATRMARASITSLEEEVEELQGRGGEFIRVARELVPALAKEAEPDLDEALAVVRRVLESCRAADAMVEERVRSAEALRAAELTATRARDAQTAAEATLKEAKAEQERVKTAWRDYLSNLGLDMNLSPGTTRDALECMERCLTAEQDCKRLRDEYDLQQRERDALAGPLAELLEQLGRKPHPGLDGQPDWLGTLDILQRDAESARQTQEERKRLLGQKSEQEEELRNTLAQEEDAARSLRDLLARGKAADPEDFRRLAAVLDERRGLERRCQDLEDTLRLAAGDNDVGEFLAEFADLEKSSLDVRHAEVSRRLEYLQEEEHEQASALAGFSAALATLVDSRRLAELRQEEAVLSEVLESLSRDWSRYALARRLLLDARHNFEKERQPEVVRLASDIFSAITGGEWSGVAASLEDSALHVLPPHGQPVAPEVLSRGAQEQLYLAMRLAHIRSHGRSANPLPVIMDDILVNFDPGRAERTILALADLVQPADQGPGHQILFFTCHPHTAEKMIELVPQSALFHVENGSVRAA